MENPNSFDLNCAIQDWRENLAQSPAFRRENLDELETHLRDSVVPLQDRGLSAEEAFMVATKRIGNESLLTNEFGKMNLKVVWLDRILWGLIAIQVWNWVGIFSATLASNFVLSNFSRFSYDLGVHGVAIPVGLLTLANLLGFVGSLGLGWWLIRRFRQALRLGVKAALRTRGTFVLTVAVIFLLCLVVAFLGLATRLMPYPNEQVAAMYSLYMAFSSNLMMAIKTIALATLTVFFAQKRLRLRQT
jgi:hypothetical protein